LRYENPAATANVRWKSGGDAVNDWRQSCVSPGAEHAVEVAEGGAKRDQIPLPGDVVRDLKAKAIKVGM
jgi:hypothetical protein